MSVNQETRERIVAAAETLFKSSDEGKFPSVDAVRREARADMNATSIVMKEWRREQTASPSKLAVDVPASVKKAFVQALGSAWQEAQALANESLAGAQACWDTERQESEALRKELSEAYEAQEKELEKIRAELKERAKEKDKADQEIRDLRNQLSDLEKSTAAEKAELEKELAVMAAQLQAAIEMRDLLEDLKKDQAKK